MKYIQIVIHTSSYACSKFVSEKIFYARKSLLIHSKQDIRESYRCVVRNNIEKDQRQDYTKIRMQNKMR